jgi:FlaA1/EpsC-like NDP-sugar epimerase
MLHVEWLYTRLGKVVVDAVILSIALVTAYLIRFEAAIPSLYFGQMIELGPYLILIATISLGASGTYNRVWRYTNLRDAMVLPVALGIPVTIIAALRFTLPDAFIQFRVPLGIIAAYFLLALVGTVGVRAAWRVLYERRGRQATPLVARRLLIIGAGDAGIRLARDLAHRKDVKLIGFLDDDVRKRRARILGVRVRGNTSELIRVLVAHRVDEVVVACSLPDQQLRAIVDDCESVRRRVRVLNAADHELAERVSGRLRDVRIEDLLRRQVVRFDTSAPSLVQTYRGRRVLVTGAGGSIGSELCRRLVALYPEKLLLLDQDENNLFETHSDLVHRGAPRDLLVDLIADVRQVEVMRRVFAEHRPEVVLHAAAFKHVPFLEEHPLEAVENNVLATSLLVELAIEHATHAFVLISTDKAVRPTSIMGASKRAAEIVVQQASGRGVRMSCVRFGNVLESRGSVVPIFRRQIARGGPVTVTHQDATRYFMTMSEAAQLVLQAGSLGHHGEVFVLNMGNPVRIVDLAQDLIQLAGLKVPDDIELQFVGLRPGERLHEEVADAAARLRPTPFDDVLLAPVASHPVSVVQYMLRRLADAVARRDGPSVIATLNEEPVLLRSDVNVVAPQRPAQSLDSVSAGEAAMTM